MMQFLRKASLCVALAMVSVAAHAEYAINLPTPHTPMATQIHELHSLILWVCVVIFVIVFGFMFYSIFKHRKSAGHQAAHFHENTAVEIAWTLIPLVILMAMAWPATKTMIEMRDTPNPDMTIKITGSQWKWEYEYPDEGIKFTSNLATPQEQINNEAEKGEHYLLEVDNPMVVPVGQKIRIVLTSRDVIHAWWVPAFGVKPDTIPGFIRDAWFTVDKPGTYRGQCAELCGKGHAYMPIVVEAMEVADYQNWVTSQKEQSAAAAAGADKEWTKEDLIATGKGVYEKNCAVCHQANGQGLPPAFPALTGSKIVAEPNFGEDGKLLPDSHLDRVFNGKGIMPAFKGTLSDTDIAAVVTYERNALGNSVGDLVQPAQVKALR
jgi:cytochrome c oxidase subunit 2